MTRRIILGVLTVSIVAAILAAVLWMRRPELPSAAPDLPAAQAAQMLRSEAAFTTRQNSPITRQLVAVIAVRRIGRSSTEVEFTWRNSAPAAGDTETPVRTSMALFRVQDTGEWRLTTLFRVD